ASRLDVIQGQLEWGNQLSGRDRKAANNTVDGLLRLLYPDPEMEVPAEFLAWAATIALESRRRVKEAQAFIGADEFGQTDLSFSIGGGPEVIVYCDESLMHRAQLERETRDGQIGARAASSEMLPAPDSGEVTSSVHARDYAVGDTIGGRF